MTAIGIDLGEGAVYVVAADGRGVERSRVFVPSEIESLVEFCAGATDIAIDAPSDLSRGVHAQDETISPKFRVARCGEIAAGRDVRAWVSWVTPVDIETCKPWMVTGFTVWDALRAAGHHPMEVYPFGAFMVLAGRRPANKETVIGHRQRRDLLARFFDLPEGIELWGHDGIDALGAAVVAQQGRAAALRAGHDDPGCDGSEIWFPAT